MQFHITTKESSTPTTSSFYINLKVNKRRNDEGSSYVPPSTGGATALTIAQTSAECQQMFTDKTSEISSDIQNIGSSCATITS